MTRLEIWGVEARRVTFTNWNGNLTPENELFTKPKLPLAGFSIIEANDIAQVVQLVTNTSCARAKGGIEIRPFWDFSEKSESNNA